MFKKAERHKAKLRLALSGTSGSGKTMGALLIAKGIGGKIAVLDTERGSASLYAHVVDFDVVELGPPYSPERFIEVVIAAEKAGYDTLILDSITHEWKGAGGVLQIVEDLARSKFKGNSYAAWNEGTPRHQKFIDSMLHSNMHIICTMRSKAVYVETEKNGRKGLTKEGAAPEQRDGLEYEFTAVLDVHVDGNLALPSKNRTPLFKDPFVISEQSGADLLEWLNSGKDVPPPPPEFTTYDLEDVTAKFASCHTMDDVKREWLAVYKPGHHQLAALTDIKDAAKARLEFVGDSPKTNSEPDDAPLTKDQQTAIQAHCGKLFKKDQRDERLAYIGGIIGRELDSVSNMTKAEAHLFLETAKQSEAA